MYQKIVLSGHLGRKPEVRYTPTGVAVCQLSVATNRRWRDRDSGEVKEQTTWFKVVTWRQLAEACGKYLSKGQQVLVEGEMEPATPYQTKEGVWRADLEVKAHTVIWTKMRGGDGEEQSQAEPQQTTTSGKATQSTWRPSYQTPDVNTSQDEESIPF